MDSSVTCHGGAFTVGMWALSAATCLSSFPITFCTISRTHQAQSSQLLFLPGTPYLPWPISGLHSVPTSQEALPTARLHKRPRILTARLATFLCRSQSPCKALVTPPCVVACLLIFIFPKLVGSPRTKLSFIFLFPMPRTVPHR